jgi:hypothetical protein
MHTSGCWRPCFLDQTIEPTSATDDTRFALEIGIACTGGWLRVVADHVTQVFDGVDRRETGRIDPELLGRVAESFRIGLSLGGSKS